MKVLPENILKRMDQKDRASLGKAGLTAAEAEAKKLDRDERELQCQIAQLLNLRNIPYFAQRMDKRSTGKRGTPDFICCYRGRFIALECKTGNAQCTQEQLDTLSKIQAHGGAAVVVRTLEEAMHVFAAIDSLLSNPPSHD